MNENDDDDEREYDSSDFTASSDIEAFPVDLFGVTHLLRLDFELLTTEQILWARLLNTTSTDSTHAAMHARIEHPVVAVVVQQVILALLKLEVYIS